MQEFKMKKAIKDFGFSFSLLIALSLLLFFQKEPLSWVTTFSLGDKNPYGTYVLAKQAKIIFPKKQFYEARIGAYQLLKNNFDGNVIIVCRNLDLSEEDLEAINQFCAAGQTVTIFTQYFSSTIEEAWNFEVNKENANAYWQNFIVEEKTHKETFKINNKSYQIYNPGGFYYFDSLKTDYHILATDEENNPIVIEKTVGKGKLILGLTPLVFTNLFLLDGQNYEIAEFILNQSPVENSRFVTYYELGRLPFNAAAMLIFNNAGYKTAFFLLSVLSLLYLLFKSKRLERPIPVYIPPSNASLEFSNMLGILFYQQKQFKKAGSMLIRQISNHLFHHYNLRDVSFNDDEISALMQRTGKTENQVKKLIKEINFINSQTQISGQQLYQLYMAYHKFKHHAS